MPQFEIRPYRPGDEESINQGFNEVFGLQRGLDEWRWKFRPELCDGSRIQLAANDCGEIVAQYASIGMRTQVFGKPLQAWQPVDLYCKRSSDAAHGRVFLKTAQRFYAAYDRPEQNCWFFGFPGERSTRLGLLRLNYGPPLPVPIWRRPAAGVRVPWRRRHEVSEGMTPEEQDALWARCAARYPVAVVRDGQRLVQRYREKPGGNYRYLAARRRGGVHAAAVLRQEENRVQIVDLLWDGDSRAAVRALEAAAAQAAAEQGATELEFWMSGDAELAAALERGGWRLTEHPHGLYLSVRSAGIGQDPALLTQRFYVTMGDTDLA